MRDGVPAPVAAGVREDTAAEPVRVTIPPRYCPLPGAAHPEADRLNACAAAWIQGHGLCRNGAQRVRMAGNDCGGFYGRIMPAAPAGRLQLAVDWCVLMFAFDDLHCDEGPASLRAEDFTGFATRLLRVLEAPGTVRGGPADPFLAAADDLAARCRAAGTPVQVRRMVDGHRAWFLGVLWEFGCRLRDRTPSLDDYAHLRQHTAAGTATMSWTEIIDGTEIPGAVMDSPAVRALNELAFTTAAFDDDLFSYGKERWLAARSPYSSRCRLNLVDILAAEHGLGLEAALAAAVDLCDRLTLRFIQLRDRVLPTACAPLRLHLDHLSHLIRGNIEWGLRAGRYSNPDGRHPGAVTTTGSFTGTAPRADAPPPLPSIAWWWDRF
ncbi:terpene synthase [Streptomyces chrestomyceticus JCM 4735]|uniref:Terpene synthase n=1 Tax=Streptomyces chrestomyceticus JCM 4735 TaxID=1306181 RepID=A0A7U9PUZ1_9ACTN|nr:glutamate dehydrogenase [Streptomyces chrestomyceticus]GCD33712.1 terpene synthase [Streptomyces chrestomyceticus JCM 4735]